MSALGYWHHPKWGVSGYADFNRERRRERSMWKWRGKQGNRGWIHSDRWGYRLGLFTIPSIKRGVK